MYGSYADVNISAPIDPSVRLNGWNLDINLNDISHTRAWRLADPQERAWQCRLLLEAWNNIPVGSLPGDLRELAGMLHVEHNWLVDHADRLLEDWGLCADGNLYHPLLIDRAEACVKRQKKSAKKKQSKTAGDRFTEEQLEIGFSPKSLNFNKEGQSLTTYASIQEFKQAFDANSLNSQKAVQSFQSFEELGDESADNKGLIDNSLNLKGRGQSLTTYTSLQEIKQAFDANSLNSHKAVQSFQNPSRARAYDYDHDQGRSSDELLPGDSSNEKSPEANPAAGRIGSGQTPQSSKRPWTPLQKIRELWIEHVDPEQFCSLQYVEHWPKRRKQRVRTLWKDAFPDLETWEAYFRMLSNAAHTRQNGPRITFDEAIAPCMLVPVTEGASL